MFESSKYAEDLTNVQCTLLLVSILDIISCTCTMQYTWQPLHSHYTRSTSLKMQETLSLRVYMQKNCKCSTDRTTKAKKSSKLNAELVIFTHTE